MFDFWHKWFVFAAAAMVVMGLGLAVLGLTPAMALVTGLYDPFFWGARTPDAGAVSFQVFAFGVIGALMAGWGVMALGLGLNAMARRERWAWIYAVEAIALWFVVDTAMSWASGGLINIAGNIGFLLLFAPPLIGMRKFMTGGRQATGGHTVTA
ncbi:MAG: hypothetical protein O7C63_00875 [Alphaproteobacteria bacterium]|nr:hypothetical protein [Alphaproteobacteria bacterium]